MKFVLTLSRETVVMRATFGPENFGLYSDTFYFDFIFLLSPSDLSFSITNNR